MTFECRLPYIENNEVIVPLTMGKIAVASVEDFDAVSGRVWTCAKRGDLFYAYRQDRTAGCMLMHRVILGAQKGDLVDHKDRDGLNNRRDNIRICSHSQNMMNRKIPKHNTSGYKGVKLTKSGRWEASIRSNGSYHYLGLFDSAERAHQEYMAASARLHVDFGRRS